MGELYLKLLKLPNIVSPHFLTVHFKRKYVYTTFTMEIIIHFHINL
jgi:hypothetical protein